MSNRPLHIGFIGQRGVPASFGGIEHHVEQLGTRLADRGHRVTVFCRDNYVDRDRRWYKGMRLITLPVLATKHAEAISHSVLAATWALGPSPFDIVHLHALGPGLVSPLLRWGSTSKVVQTIHGLDNKRSKWSGGVQRILTTGEYLSAHVPDRTIVVADYLKDYYARTHGAHVHAIPNGVIPPAREGRDTVDAQFGLDGRRYVLFVGRLVPEKAPDVLIQAFAEVPGDVRLVIAGDSSFTDDYVTSLKRLAGEDPRVVFTGYVYGRTLAALYTNASLFVLPSRLEGLPLTLLEAASYGIPIVVSAIEPHFEVLGHDAPGRRLVDTDRGPLAAAIRAELSDPDTGRAGAQTLCEQVAEDL